MTMVNRNLRRVICHLFFAALLLANCAFAQEADPTLPCSYSGLVLRTNHGQLVRYLHNDFKTRATHKVDISGPIRQVDIKGTVVVDVLVGPKGNVVCTKMLNGHPLFRKPIEDALSAWTFKPVTRGGRPVAYVGELEFSLCNIDCGEAGPSVTILK